MPHGQSLNERDDAATLSRRQLLGSAGALGLSLAGAGLLAGCGGGSGSASSATTASAKPKQGGTLQVALSGGGSGDTLDGQAPLTTADVVRVTTLYDQLTQVENDAQLRYTLVELVESNSAGDVWTIRVKPGIEFHNGKTLDADDVIFSIQRILDPKTHADSQTTFSGFIDPNGFTKLDSRTVRIHMKRPMASFAAALGDGSATAIVPVGYNPKQPIGTGAFKYESFTPGQQSVFTQFPNYWGPKPHVDKLVLLDISDDSARVNALLSGQVDAIDTVPFAQIPVVQGNSQCRILESKTGSFYPITMRTDVAPFNDVRVRQAMRLMLDRKQAVEVALSGHGIQANDVYSPYDPAFDASLVRNQDIEQAKSLLKQAGRSGMSVQLVTAPLGNGLVEVCSVLARNAAQAGVTINVRATDAATLYGSNYTSWQFAVDYFGYYQLLTTASLTSLPGGVVNATHFNDPTFNTLFYQAEATTDDAKRKDILFELQKVLFDSGQYIIPYFPNSVDAYRANTAGWPQQDLTGVGLGRAKFNEVYFV